MESFHPVRHRVGVILVCLIALATAREGWNLLGNRSNVKAVSATERAIPRPLPEYSSLVIDREHIARNALRPTCTMGGALKLPCCDLTLGPPVEADHDFVFALSPETFPLAAQFMSEPVPANATINPALLEVAKKIEPLQPDSYILWLPPVTKCGTAKKDSQGKEYCAPGDPVEVPEPANLALVLGGGAAVLFSTRHRR